MELKEKNEKNWMLPVSILIAGVIIAGAIIYSNGLNATQKDKTKIGVDQPVKLSADLVDKDDVVYGKSDAPLTIVEFGDLQCPFCAKYFKEVEVQVVKNYVETGKAKLVYKPMAFLGPESVDAANAVACAKDQGKFWEFRNAITGVEYNELQQYLQKKISSSENNGNLNVDLFKRMASGLNMNVDDFVNCYNSGKHLNDYKLYGKEADATGTFKGTPAIYVNGQKVELQMNDKNEFDYQAFSAKLDQILTK